MAWSKVRWRLPALISGLLTLLGLLLALDGGPLMLVWLGALASFSILLLRWMKPGPAIASTTIAFLSAELLLLRISPLLPIGLIGCELVVWTCVGLGCAPPDRWWADRSE